MSEFIAAASNAIYQWYALPLLLVTCGLYLTIRTGFVQIRGFAGGVRRVVRGMSHDQEGEGEITPFQALSTALAVSPPERAATYAARFPEIEVLTDGPQSVVRR